MRVIIRHWWSLVFWFGMALFVGASGGFYGRDVIEQSAPLPTPYTFDLDVYQTGHRADGYHLVGIVNKLACEREPVPSGYRIEVITPYGQSDASWHSFVGNDPNESRPSGSSSVLHHVIDLPDVFEVARVYTLHACPSRSASDPRYVRTLMHTIPGNIVEQSVTSASQGAEK